MYTDTHIRNNACTDTHINTKYCPNIKHTVTHKYIKLTHNQTLFQFKRPPNK